MSGNPVTALVITPMKIERARFKIVGTAPFVQHKFSKKARDQMLAEQQKTAGTKGRKKKEPRDIEADYLGAMHIGDDHRNGIPCGAFRSALIDACRAAGFVMTKAKMSIFCQHDTIDKDDGTPLVHINGDPEMHQAMVRIQNTSTIAVRPMWREWSVDLTLEWDGEQFSVHDVANLLARAGVQVGVGEGRPFSKSSHGMGWGTFRIANHEEFEQ